MEKLVSYVAGEPTVEKRCRALLYGIQMQIAAIKTRDPFTLEELNMLLAQFQANTDALVAAVNATVTSRGPRILKEE